jgi:hypothetical protein
VALNIPSPPVSIGPFTATGGAITVSAASQTALTLMVSGNALSLKCTAYANNAVTSGITSSTPPGSPITPQLATATAGGSGSSGATTTTAASTPTTVGPSTAAASGSLANTGAGPGLYALGAVGILGLVLFALLTLGNRARAAWLSSERSPGADTESG